MLTAALALLLSGPNLLHAAQTSRPGQPAGPASVPKILGRFDAAPQGLRLVIGSFLRGHVPDTEWLLRETAGLDAAAMRRASRSRRPRGAPTHNELFASEAARDFLRKAASPRHAEEKLDVALRLALLQAVIPPLLNKDERSDLAKAARVSRGRLLDKDGRRRLDDLMRQMTLALSARLEEKSLAAREPSDAQDLRTVVRTLYDWEARPREPSKAGSPVDRLGPKQLEELRLLAGKTLDAAAYSDAKKKLEAVQEHLLTLTQLALLTSPRRDHAARGILLDAIKALEPKLPGGSREFRAALETLAFHAGAPVEIVYDQARRRYVDGRAWIARQLLSRLK